MPLARDSVLRRPFFRRLGRHLGALGVVAAVVLVRAAADPYLHAQLPYMFFVGGIVVATWLCGVEAGLVAIVAASFTANYFFVFPRYEFIPHPDDWRAMGTFSAVALSVVWFVWRSRRAEWEIRELHAQTTAVLEEMPVGVLVADPSGQLRFSNAAAQRILRHPFIPSETAAQYGERNKGFHANGTIIRPEEYPLSRALTGETVAEEEIHVVRGDGTRGIVSVSAAPIPGAHGGITGAVATLMDITAQKQADEALRERAEELQATLDTVPAAVFVTRDPDARHMDGNRYAAEYVRVPPGSNMSKTAPEDERPAAFRVTKDGRELLGEELPVQMAMARGVEVRDFEFDFAYHDGTSRTLFGNATPLLTKDGKVRGSVGAFVDITDRKRSEQALHHANRVKDEFLATLSHELRTPLNAIHGWAHMLKRGRLHPDVATRAIESTCRNAEALSEMINDVLDVSRIISGKLRLDTKPVDPCTLLENTVESLRPAAAGKGIAVATDFEPMPVPVSGDPVRLQQVFSNLLSNAIKFTPAGGHIRVSLRRNGPDLEVQVADSGIGIAPEFLPHVFERFRQHDSSSTRRFGGLGLGLAIVRHLVELHGGSVSAESDGEGRGATFTVRLPAEPWEARAGRRALAVRRDGAIEAVPVGADLVRGVHVLVVDDDEDAREVVAAVMRDRGATVALAATAREALDRIRSFRPQVLLVDLAMPEIDGYMLMERVRESDDAATASLPAIALTAYAREEDRQRALASGFQIHLAKPVHADTLVRAVASVCAQQRETAR